MALDGIGWGEYKMLYGEPGVELKTGECLPLSRMERIRPNISTEKPGSKPGEFIERTKEEVEEIARQRGANVIAEPRSKFPGSRHVLGTYLLFNFK